MNSLLLIGTLCAQAVANVQLSGRVVDEQGRPLAGAIVVVSTCQPKVGPATVCPSCYVDCKQRTATNGDGRFTFNGLTNSLKFSLAVGARGFQGTITEYVDPLDDKPLEIGLNKPITDDDSSSMVVRGSVVDLDGRPIAGAVLRLRRAQRGNRISGSDPSVTPVTIAAADGQFEATAGAEVAMVAYRASAAGFAPLELEWYRNEKKPLEFRLGRGASVTGQLLHNGRPLPSVRVGIVQTDRTLGNTVTPELLSTDGDGVFRFDSLPPDRDYAIYTDLDQKSFAALPVSLVRLPAHGKLAVLGKIATKPAGPFVVVLRTADGQGLPPGVVYIGRDKAWHTAVLKFQSEGKSEVTLSVPSVGEELVQVNAQVPGYAVHQVAPHSSPGLNREYSFRTKEVRQVTLVLGKQ